MCTRINTVMYYHQLKWVLIFDQWLVQIIRRKVSLRLMIGTFIGVHVKIYFIESLITSRSGVIFW